MILVFEVFLLVAMSAVCSGLNVAIMSLDIADLRRQSQMGDYRAKKVLPLRRNGHLTLASILLTNVAVISASSLVLEKRFAGLIAGALSTLLIVIFGEVVPQAIFTRNSLAFTYRCTTLMRLMIVATYPISKPLQLLLDKMLGHEKNRLEGRHELGIIIAEHAAHKNSELDDGEIDIIRGALQLSEKRVRDIMTPIKSVYWLKPDSIIDAEKIDEIKHKAHSRMPVFDPTKTKCLGVILQKDLVDIDFDEMSYSVQQLPLHPTKIVGSMTALDTLFKKFIASHSHLLPVERDNKIVGIVTIEDLIEEIIGHEIEDESDRQRLKN